MVPCRQVIWQNEGMTSAVGGVRYRLSRRIVLGTELWDRHRKIQYKYQCFVYHANSPPDRQTIQTGDSVRGSGTTAADCGTTYVRGQLMRDGAAGRCSLLSRQVPLLPAFGRVVGFKASGLARLPLGGSSHRCNGGCSQPPATAQHQS